MNNADDYLQLILVQLGEAKVPYVKRRNQGFACVFDENAPVAPPSTRFGTRKLKAGVWHLRDHWDPTRDQEIAACGKAIPAQRAVVKAVYLRAGFSPCDGFPNLRICKRCVP